MIIRTFLGIQFFMMERKKLDKAVTKVTLIERIRVFVASLVTAKVEQMPKICTNTGLFPHTLFVSICTDLDAISVLPFANQVLKGVQVLVQDLLHRLGG